MHKIAPGVHGPHLRALEGGHVDDPISAWNADLVTTTRCRPSELPTSLSVTLAADAMQHANAEARAAGIDVATWIRLAIEGTRQAERASGFLDIPINELVAELNALAAERLTVRPIASAPLAAYVRSLTASSASPQTSDDQNTTLHVPDELVVAWTLHAGDAGLTVDEWVSHAVAAAPCGVVAWEAAAARCGAYLGEWVLTCAASSKRRNARPQD